MPAYRLWVHPPPNESQLPSFADAFCPWLRLGRYSLSTGFFRLSYERGPRYCLPIEEKLYHVFEDRLITAVLRGEKRISECLPSFEMNADFVGPLSDVPFVPEQARYSLAEIRFADGRELEPYKLSVMDEHGSSYALPRGVVDRGQVRRVSEEETLEFARQQLDFNLLPSSETLAESFRGMSPTQLRAKYGPFLSRAYQERKGSGTSAAEPHDS